MSLNAGVRKNMQNYDDPDYIGKLIAVGETSFVEFKRRDILNDNIKLVKEMTALANLNGGLILIGVHNNGNIERMKVEKEHETHIMNIARDLCIPPLSPEFDMVQLKEGPIYVIKIKRFSNLPHAVKTKEGKVYFIRVGTTVRQASEHELAFLFESSKSEREKKPKLQLMLIDDNGKESPEITVHPKYIVVEEVKRVNPNPLVKALTPSNPYNFLEGISTSALSTFTEKEPASDLVPISVIISNVGESPAEGIKINLNFPEECELFERYDVVGGFPIANSSGFFIDRKRKNHVYAIVDKLGNDDSDDDFEEVYVKFPQEDVEYNIEAKVTHDNYPPEDYNLRVIVENQYEKRPRYVD